MSPFALITSRLERVCTPRTSKAGTTVRARCPACGGDNHSKLVVTEKPDGAVLIHCFAGCSVGAVVDALALDMSDLFPPQTRQARRGGSSTGAAHDPHTLIRMAAEAVCDAHTLLLCFVEAMPDVPEMQAYLDARITTLADVRDLLILEVRNDNRR